MANPTLSEDSLLKVHDLVYEALLIMDNRDFQGKSDLSLIHRQLIDILFRVDTVLEDDPKTPNTWEDEFIAI